MDFSAKHQEFEQLKHKVESLERGLGDLSAERSWPPKSASWGKQVAAGCLLGLLGAAAALLLNVVLAPLAGKHPLELIRVYLTVPMGAEALSLADAAQHVPTVGDGMILAFGCCLYFGTGILIGVPFQFALTHLVPNGAVRNRLLVATVLSLLIWLIGFYGILSWLQPQLFGGDWITSSKFLPWWVAAGTHLVFGWTMALLAPMTNFLLTPQSPAESNGAKPEQFTDAPLEPGG